MPIILCARRALRSSHSHFTPLHLLLLALRKWCCHQVKSLYIRSGGNDLDADSPFNYISSAPALCWLSLWLWLCFVLFPFTLCFGPRSSWQVSIINTLELAQCAALYGQHVRGIGNKRKLAAISCREPRVWTPRGGEGSFPLRLSD